MLHNGLRISLSYRCGYPQSDFAVLADGQPTRDIAVFEAENTPLDLAVVLDLSGIQQTLRVAGRVVGRPDPVRLGLIRMLDGLAPVWWTVLSLSFSTSRSRRCGNCGSRVAASKRRWESRSDFHGLVSFHNS